MRKIVLFLALCASSLTVAAQDIALRSGESIDLFGVFWIVNCKSILNKFEGADVLSGPATLSVSLKEASILPTRQGCPESVPGARLLLSAGDITEPFEGTVRLRVRYDTKDGTKQSLHTVKVLLVPSR